MSTSIGRPWRRLSARPHGLNAGSPAVEMRDLLDWQPLGRLEVGALGVGDREQTALPVTLVRDAEQLGGPALAVAEQMQRRPRRTQSARPQREHVAPRG